MGFSPEMMQQLVQAMQQPQQQMPQQNMYAPQNNPSILGGQQNMDYGFSGGGMGNIRNLLRNVLTQSQGQMGQFPNNNQGPMGGIRPEAPVMNNPMQQNFQTGGIRPEFPTMNDPMSQGVPGGGIVPPYLRNQNMPPKQPNMIKPGVLGGGGPNYYDPFGMR